TATATGAVLAPLGGEAARGMARGLDDLLARRAAQQSKPLIVAEGGSSEVELVLQYKPHGDKDEFLRQLALQDEGFANATAGDIRARIERFRAEGRPLEASASIREARRQSPEEASGTAALHAPDCCIGGDPKKVVGFGGIPENSSI